LEPAEGTRRGRDLAEPVVAADGAGSTAIRGILVLQPAPLLNSVVRVRHEVAGGIGTLRCHQRFCPLYPIGTCVAGNGGVPSSRDNVSALLGAAVKAGAHTATASIQVVGA